MKKIVYEIVICTFAIISVVFAVLDMTSGLNSWMIIADRIIYLIFVTDYIFRLAVTKNKKEYVKQNVLDLIAIIPVSSAFRIFRTFKIFRFLKIAKLTKLTRILTVSGQLISKCKTFLDTNGFKYMLLLSFILVLVGGALISFFENMNFVDGIWWAFVTTTTVGYGDISPASVAGRIIACVLMITGIGLIGSLTSTITSFFIGRKDDHNISCDKVDMALSLYNQLNDAEKDMFKKII